MNNPSYLIKPVFNNSKKLVITVFILSECGIRNKIR